MTKTALGVRRQHIHSHVQAETLQWFDVHYQPSGFNGRFQLGYRQHGERGVWPLFTGERDRLREFVETMHVSANVDYYITPNSVSGTVRQAEQLFSLHNIVIDIDAHELDAVPTVDDLEELAWRMKRDVFDIEPLPSPTVVLTGRGLQIWWAVIPMSAKCLPWLQEIQQTLVCRLNAFLSDYPDFAVFDIDAGASNNSVGYFRFPGTFNTTAGICSQVLFLASDQMDTHEAIKWAKAWKAEDLVTVEHKPTDDFSGQYLASDIHILRDIHTTALFRVQQLIRLRLLRDNDIGAETRNNLCLIVYNAMLLSLGPDKAWDKLCLFNKGFKIPMAEKELHQVIDTSLRKGGYRYRNSTIISFLGVTEDEQAAIGLYEPSEPFSPMTRLSNHPARKAASKTVKEDRDAKIKALTNTGLNKSQVAHELGVSRGLVTTIVGSVDKTIRNKQIQELAAQNLSKTQIAKTLGLSLSCVADVLGVVDRDARAASILGLAAQGCNQTQIAKMLGISRPSVLAVLGATDKQSRTDRIMELFRQGLNKSAIAETLGVSRTVVINALATEAS